MATQMFAITGDPRLKRRKQVAALNARLPLLPQMLERQREDERFEYQKKIDKKRLGIQKRSARDAREIGERQLEQQEKADRAAMGIKGFGLATRFMGEGDLAGIFGGDEKPSNVPGSYSGAKIGASTQIDPSGARHYTGTAPKATTSFQPSGTKGRAMSTIPSGNISGGSGSSDIFQGIKGSITPGTTLGAGLAGFGAGSIFGKKKPVYGALAGAAAGGLMNLFGGGAPGMYDDMMSMFSGGIGGALSSLF